MPWYDVSMAVPLLDTLTDLLSATSGALAGAVVTGLFNRGRRRQLSDQVIAGQQALAHQQAENERLMEIIKDKESFILQLEEKILESEKTKAVKKRGN